MEEVTPVLEEKERSASYKPVFVTEITDDLHFYVQDVETGECLGPGPAASQPLAWSSSLWHGPAHLRGPSVQWEGGAQPRGFRGLPRIVYSYCPPPRPHTPLSGPTGHFLACK